MSATITLPRPLVERTIEELNALAEQCDHSVGICWCTTWAAIADLSAALCDHEWQRGQATFERRCPKCERVELDPETTDALERSLCPTHGPNLHGCPRTCPTRRLASYFEELIDVAAQGNAPAAEDVVVDVMAIVDDGNHAEGCRDHGHDGECFPGEVGGAG